MRLVYVGLGWITGIILAASGVHLPVGVWAGLSVMMLGIIITTWRSATHRWIDFVLLAFVLGGLRVAFVPQTADITAFHNTGGLTIQGVVRGEPDIRDDFILLRVDAETVVQGMYTYPVDGSVLVRTSRRGDVQYGDRVAVTGMLYPPARYDTFSYADYLARRGIFSMMEQARVEVLESDRANPLLRQLYRLRRDAAGTIGRKLPEPQAGLLTGILLGYEGGISPELNADFQAVGASHVIAISGFNMVIIAGVVLGLLRRTFGPRREILSASLAIGVLCVYTIVAGGNAAVVRAALMSSLLIVGEAYKRRTYVPASLMFTALVMSLHDPHVLWNVSFQLSFFAVLGLALFADPVQAYFDTLLAQGFSRRTVSRVGNFLAEPVVVSLAVQMTTLPVVLLYFGQVSLVFLAVNLLILPVQAHLLIVGGVATLLAPVIPLVAQVLYWVDYLFLSWTIGVVRLFAKLPFASAAIHISPMLIYGYFIVLIGWALMHATQPEWWLRLVRFIRNRAVMVTMAGGGVALAVLMGVVAWQRPDDKLHVWFLDVGHSNAVLVQTPGGAQLLVDGGRYPSRLLTAIGDRMPLVDREIDVLVISQPDEFDTGALPQVLDRYAVGVVLTNGQPHLGDAQAALDTVLAGKTVIAASAGYTLDFDDGTRLEVLHPQITPQLGDNLNDYPLVLRVSYGDVSFLLPSDLSQSGQAALLEAGQWPLATVLQLPNHATQRSLDTAFLAAVQPQAIVVQSDIANRRGDPDPDVLALLPEGVPVFRTDTGGTIHLWTDGVNLWAAQ